MGMADAALYDPVDTSIGGLHAFFITRGDPRQYNLPPQPEIPTMAPEPAPVEPTPVIAVNFPPAPEPEPAPAPAGRWDAAESHLVFFQGADGYELVERSGPPPSEGSSVGEQIVARVASAPIPGSALPCAYLVA